MKQCSDFDVLLTVHLSIFISVFTNLMHKIFILQYVYFMPLHVSSTCAHHQEVKIALHSLWYHHTYKWPSCAQVERGLPIGMMIPEAVNSNFDLLMMSTCAQNM